MRVSPVYEDCYEGRDRCQGHRPCRERLDAMYLCRGTALLCPHATWQATLRAAKVSPPSTLPTGM